MARLSTKREARTHACELARKYDTVPVPIRQIAKEMGVTVISHHLDDDVSGFLIVKDRKPVIVVNKRHHPTRQRFTIAHELGHYQLHFQDSDEVFHRDELSGHGTSRMEIQANTYAGELLMPREEVERALGPTVLDAFNETSSEQVEKVARKFGVSQHAMSIRLQQLGRLV